MENTLAHRVTYMRMGAALERCHKKPHLMRYSVGQHTHDMLSLLVVCWKEDHNGSLPRAELLVACHVHDHPEIVVGDIPSPTKDLIGAPLDIIERNAEEWCGLNYYLNEEERQYLHAADRFELWLWCKEEARRGNVNFLDWEALYANRWSAEETILPPSFQALFEYYEANDVVNLNDAQLKAIGGMDRL